MDTLFLLRKKKSSLDKRLGMMIYCTAYLIIDKGVGNNTKHVSLRKDSLQALIPGPLHSVCMYTHIVYLYVLI